MDIICRDSNGLKGWSLLYVEFKHFTSAEVLWIVIVKDNKHFLPFNYAEDISKVIIATCRLDYWTYKRALLVF